MSNEVPPLAAVRKMPSPPPRPASFRREWLPRAAFEGVLIAASLVGALALNEWKESRDRQARVRDALIAVRTELQANRTEIARVVARNAEIIGKIATATEAGRTYEGPILAGADLVSAAWDSVRAAAITNDMALPTLMALGRAYEAQDKYEREMGAFNDALYGGLVGDIRRDPQRMAGTIRDLDRHARRLDERYDAALKALASR